MIVNVSESEQTLELDYKNGDIVRWLDYDPKYLEPNAGPLPVDTFLECETLSGKNVIVHSENARLITSKIEMAKLLQRRPRAKVVTTSFCSTPEELSVEAGETIYILYECNSTDFMAVNKRSQCGRVPKRLLNFQAAPQLTSNRFEN
ncbi:unnamed protein product [Hydatigera taeniaeformis]|uniref:SH3 domain-containing protein n=1 Tax=Hydatigena taeniaeformis TaxID=6205 RepID=A0A0R3WIM6_HYDTA|nr:unnamed protein product [Hydatigera taeniaeformis]